MKLRHAAEYAAAAGVAFLAVLLVWHLARPGAGVGRALANGETPSAPSFGVESLTSDGRIDLTRYAGRVIVLNFWASWCGPCKQEAAGFERTAHRLHDSIVTFVGVDVRDAKSDARRWLRHHRISYPVGHDGSGRATQLYGVGALPATFIISPQGRIVDRVDGFLDEKELQRRIARALRLAGAS